MKLKTARRFINRNQYKVALHIEKIKLLPPSFIKRLKQAIKEIQHD